MDPGGPHIAQLVEARQMAGRRYVSLALSLGVTRFTTRKRLNEAQLAQLDSARAEWMAAKRAIADYRHSGLRA